MRRDMYWDYEACQCISKSVVPRGVEDQLGCGYHPVSVGRGNRALDIAGWVLLGSCLALVVIWQLQPGIIGITIENIPPLPIF